MKTIAELINWDFGANGRLEIKDKKGNRTYFELADGFWARYEYDSKGNQIYLENSSGFWEKTEYDSKNLVVYHQDSEGNKEDYRPKPSVV